MKKTIAIILSGLFTVSCVDTVLLPDNKTVEEDFWQTKDDVAMMVNGAYLKMAEVTSLQQSFVVWTSRSDELVVNETLHKNSLNQIQSANIVSTNEYCNWGDLYAVINQCNLIIDKSAEVMNIDPNYMEGDHLNNVAQMKALRALCYFYLIRVFRDVPLVLEPYKLSSQETDMVQSSPAEVLDRIISDVEEAKNYTLSTQFVKGNTRNVYFTRDGVYALLADLYLWKASVYGDEGCYNKCIECCNVIRANRKMAGTNQTNSGQGRPGAGQGEYFDDDGYNLNTYKDYFTPFTELGNQEVLFELHSSTNEGLCNVYDKSEDKNSAQPLFYVSPIYAVCNTSPNYVFNHANYTLTDVRGAESVYGFASGVEEQVMVRKYVAVYGLMSQSSVLGYENKNVIRSYTNYDQNWIVYRTTDVMLMKAEALVQKGLLQLYAHNDLLDRMASVTTQTDSLELGKQLAEIVQKVKKYNVEAARQVQITSARARIDGITEIDSTEYAKGNTVYNDGDDITKFVKEQISAFNGLIETAQNLEVEVMNERARELCFEGKRWFDMLRYNYRHTTGVNYHTILAQQGGAYAKNSEDMLDLIARKFTSGGGPGITAKMPTEPYLYMPIKQSEMEVNPLLMQNPVYTDGGTVEKNY